MVGAHCALLQYEEYCRGFDAAQKAFDAAALDAGFAEFLRATKVEQPLPSLLMMPVQRIPRYKLLLEDLLKVGGEFGVVCKKKTL